MSSTQPQGDVATSMSAVMLRAARRLTTGVETELQESGLGIDHWLSMDALASSAGLTMAELQAATLTAGPTLTRVVDRLVTRALVYREVDQFDRRKVRVFLSKRGTTLHRSLRERIAPVEVEWATANQRELNDHLAAPSANL
ncbi:MarR family transcriptional regulator [Mycolicibacterium sp. P9-64]|uniref:MarR family winged helix-turn-helix transcriptional regulator n=1 Tax=Mycolicibacterium sp. P9-64 TaxID=2024612 RepID=UPI0032216602